MRVFVTGAGGYLGRVVAASVPGAVAGSVRSRPAPRRTETFELDVRDEAAVAAAFAAFRPDAVIHTAYSQHGDEAQSINVEGSAAIARAAHAIGARLVHMSSDVIFGGAHARAILEEDPPDPVTPYGAAKAEAEVVVVAEHPEAVLVRTSLIYGGSEPSNHELAALDPEATFYEDELRCPIAVSDLAAAVLELAAMPDVRGPLNVAGADAVSRLEFAQLVCAAHGRDPRAVRGAPRPPDRPGDIRLDSSRARELLSTRLRGVRAVL